MTKLYTILIDDDLAARVIGVRAKYDDAVKLAAETIYSAATEHGLSGEAVTEDDALDYIDNTVWARSFEMPTPLPQGAPAFFFAVIQEMDLL